MKGFKPKHGLYKHPLYNGWRSMRQRCQNPKQTLYRYYGGRGITVCEQWQDPETFIRWAEANGYEPGLEIDRIDPTGNYEPGNCRFITKGENLARRRLRGPATDLGHRCKELAAITGFHPTTIRNRILLGWSDERIRSTPRRKAPADISRRCTELAAITGLDRHAIRVRVLAGWSDERIVSTPLAGRKKRDKKVVA